MASSREAGVQRTGTHGRHGAGDQRVGADRVGVVRRTFGMHWGCRAIAQSGRWRGVTLAIAWARQDSG
jgi:hypothetical protein